MEAEIEEGEILSEETERKIAANILVEETEEKMVPFGGSTEFTKRRAYLLKPISRNHPFVPSHFKPFSISSTNTPTISFTGWMSPTPTWIQWADKLKPIYSDLWQKVGIFEAIMASTYNIHRFPPQVFAVLTFWCDETNTFIFPWGEATVTLEDVMILGGFPLLGEPVRTSRPLKDDLRELEMKMIQERSKLYQGPDHSHWISHFMEGKRDELEHIAFLSLWLARFVFTSLPSSLVSITVIPIAIRLARGERIALAPAVLARLYRDFRSIKNRVSSGRKDSTFYSCALLRILQLWLWERFLSLRPESQHFVSASEPRAARWHEVGEEFDFSFVMSVIESSDEFQWRPYAARLDDWRKPSFYRDQGEWIHGDCARNEEVRLFAYCIRACELVGLDCIEQYLPHRVAMQFGLDQGLPKYVSRACLNWRVAWESYDIGDKDVKFYIPARLIESDVTLRYSIWWKKVDVSPMERIQTENQTRSSSRKRERKLQDLYVTDCRAPLENESSLRHSDVVNPQIAESSLIRSVIVNQNADLEDRVEITELSDIGESNYDPMVDLEEVEEPKERSKCGETAEADAKKRRLAQYEEIRKLKEEIAFFSKQRLFS